MLLALLMLEGAVRVWPGLFYPGAMRTPFGVEQLTRREQARHPGPTRVIPQPDEVERPRWYGVPLRDYRHYGMEYSTRVTNNSLGFRDEDHWQRAPGVRRIVVLGDSFVEAREVAFEATFHQQLARDLNSLPGSQVEVVNFGMAGLGTADQLLILRQFGPQVVGEGDVVVLVLYMGNDVLDNSLRLNTLKRGDLTADRPGFLIGEGGELLYVARYESTAESLSPEERARFAGNDPAPNDSTPLPFPERTGPLHWGVLFLRGNSYLANAAHDKLAGGPALIRLGLVDDRPAGVPFDYGIYASEPDEAWAEALAMTVRLVEEVRDEAERQGADFLLVIAPAREQVYDEVWQETLMAYPDMQAGVWDVQAPTAALGDLLRAAGVPTLDLLAAMRACAAERSPLYERYGIHWSMAGHELVAELLAAELAADVVGVGLPAPVCAADT